jgi:MYXO-CTERM domain-containing protein
VPQRAFSDRRDAPAARPSLDFSRISPGPFVAKGIAMHDSRFLGFLPFLALSLLTPCVALAADAGAGPCTETSYGMPCDSGDGNACSGVCQPDFSKTGAPMACLATDAATLRRLKLTSLDGIDCAPAGQPGTDCTHACGDGVCVLKNAAQGSACFPATAPDASATNVCGGSCDGNGACGALDHACGMKYGRGELSICVYAACNPAANVGGCEQFSVPEGEDCSTGDVCLQGEMCGGPNGLCVGGTRISGCTEPEDGDATFVIHEQDGTDAGVTIERDAGADSATGAAFEPTHTSSGGCSLAMSRTSGGTAGLGALVVGLALARARRRERAMKRS